MMRVAAILLASLSCVAAFPAYFLAYNNGRGGLQPSDLDCNPFYPGGPLPHRCRRRRVNQTLRSRRRDPEALTVLEIIETDMGEDGPRVVEVVEEEVESPFAISIPEKKTDLRKPRCPPHQVYVSELDMCLDKEMKTLPAISSPEKTKEKKKEEEEPQPFRIMEVGSFVKEKCSSDQIWSPEVGICMDINPPAPLPAMP